MRRISRRKLCPQAVQWKWVVKDFLGPGRLNILSLEMVEAARMSAEFNRTLKIEKQKQI
jgi:hypothetical protein